MIDIINGLDIACMIISHAWDFLYETCQNLYALDHGRAVRSDTSRLHVHRHPHEHEG